MASDQFFPQLKEYDDCWPVRSFLKLRLKRTSEASRRLAQARTAKHFKKALEIYTDDEDDGGDNNEDDIFDLL